MTSLEQKTHLFDLLLAVQTHIFESDFPRTSALLALGYMLATARETGLSAKEITELAASLAIER